MPNRIVEDLLKAARKTKGSIPVKGKLNATDFKTTVMKYRGAYRLYLNTRMRFDSDTKVGDTVKIVLSFDPEPRTYPLPKELEEVLRQNAKAQAAWEKQPYSHKKEFLSYLNSLKTKESLMQNVNKIIRVLLKG